MVADAGEDRDREALVAHFRRMAEESGNDQLFTWPELEHLPEVLQGGEQVLALVSGTMDGVYWLVVLTDQRVLFLDKGLLYGMQQRSIPLARINSVSSRKGLLLGDIIISDNVQEYLVESVAPQAAEIFVSRLQQVLADLAAGGSASARKSSTAPGDVRRDPERQQADPVDRYEQLEKPFSLKQRSILTEEEFERAKRKILG